MIKLAIIGLGKWGQELVKSVNSKSKIVKFTSVISRNPEKIIKETRQLNVVAFKTFEEMLSEKKIDGFSSLFHQISSKKIGTSTIQSRALAGICNNVFIFCIPGSPSACSDAWNEILKYQLDINHKPCNLVEIMPRLSET